jgi:hypothetical protein
MELLLEDKNYTTQVSDSYERHDEHCHFEPSFRRWLVQEILEKRMTPKEAIDQFNFNPKSGFGLIQDWCKKYVPEMVVSLPDMTAAEKEKLSSIQQQLKAVEKQLEDAKMKNIAMNMLIDVAEEKLKISIRKKSGAKQ